MNSMDLIISLNDENTKYSTFWRYDKNVKYVADNICARNTERVAFKSKIGQRNLQPY